MTTEGERLATLEALLWEIRDDVTEVKKEAERTRDRLHKLEGVSALFVETQKENRRKEDAQYKRLTAHLQVIGLLFAALLFLEPFLYHYAIGK